ncbi:multidrug ABC transporter ATP-binding protein [Microbacterium barkeri]|uniref:Multidrug ABC transporter ATP-binding protein n=1 Tax=Microbacterium barkeri TaxID=33917 RepID=A0A9W6H274_9MICO|nr:ATP-binding cassette domain-containing protein [Microbacterium barkeri]MDR6877719.1 ABC-2 type transport system ATP-binding protein [Microbacterium barkeri]GLJ60875.1 multidrug ABC transporter ATP-binding protein [Microbacterium barkeri]
MITAENLTKRFGAKTAVDGISFEVRPGQVTGFLGPNGAGKSTTMRMIVGLDRPDAGSVTVNGRPFAQHAAPMTEVGALLDAKAVHPGRTAEAHLRMLAATHGIGMARVAEVMELTGIAGVARRRIGGFSLGMHQRLGIAATMLGDPHTLILDEPVNGLDPEGVHWVRGFVRSLAAEGRAIFLSSHLMSEMAQTADHIIVLGKGRILADAPVGDFLRGSERERTRVRSSDARRLGLLLADPGVAITQAAADTLDVEGLPAAQITRVAVNADIDVHELVPLRGSLEEAYLALTGDAVEYRSDPAALAA